VDVDGNAMWYSQHCCTQKMKNWPGVVLHVYNTRYLGGENRRNTVTHQLGKVSARLYLKNK
jgi:hypothetical protein